MEIRLEMKIELHGRIREADASIDFKLVQRELQFVFADANQNANQSECYSEIL